MRAFKEEGINGHFKFSNLVKKVKDNRIHKEENVQEYNHLSWIMVRV